MSRLVITDTETGEILEHLPPTRSVVKDRPRFTEAEINRRRIDRIKASQAREHQLHKDLDLAGGLLLVVLTIAVLAG